MSFLRTFWRTGPTGHKKLSEEWTGEGLPAPTTHPDLQLESGSSAGSCSSASTASSEQSVGGPVSDQHSTTSSNLSSATTSSNSAHQQHQADDSETSFELKYLGMGPISEPGNERATAEAIKSMVATAKAEGKKPSKVSLTINRHGIRMVDLSTFELQFRISIYDISYCSADGTHQKVFAFVATNPDETVECHVFECPRRRVAEAVAQRLKRAFDEAYRLWQILEEGTIANSESPQVAATTPMNPVTTRSSDSEHQEVEETARRRDETWVSFECDQEAIVLSPLIPKKMEFPVDVHQQRQSSEVAPAA